MSEAQEAAIKDWWRQITERRTRMGLPDLTMERRYNRDRHITWDDRVIIKGRSQSLSALGDAYARACEAPPDFRFSLLSVRMKHSRGNRATWQLEFIADRVAQAQRRRHEERRAERKEAQAP